jgi:hypothetical protein
MNYACVDLDPSFNSIALDLNFDSAPAEHRGRYGLVTNHGTSEHIMNQLNVFQVTHDFTKPGGLMLHAVPFTVHLEHGFFNYQPNFFNALARYNGYKTLGMWVDPDWQLTSLVPWEPSLLDYLTLNAKTTHLLVVLLQRLHAAPFRVPFQGHYETMIPDAAATRYSLVVDGELYDGRRFKQLSRAGAIVDSSRCVDQIGGLDLLRAAASHHEANRPAWVSRRTTPPRGFVNAGTNFLGFGFPVTAASQMTFDPSCNSTGSPWQAFLTVWFLSYQVPVAQFPLYRIHRPAVDFRCRAP